MIKIIYLLFCFLIISCNTVSKVPDPVEVQDFVTPITPIIPQPDVIQTLKLTFAGDIMAHNVNYRMVDYNLIYADIKEILYADDLSFANFEIPVCDELPYETYPTFNVQSPYALAAIDGGFDVFSLANNHTNDQGLQGIESSADFFGSVRSRGVYSAGIKSDSGISYEVIETQGWTILFAAITEFANSNNNIDKFDIYPFTTKGKAALTQEIVALQEQEAHDLFILSIHVADTEYDRSISDARREWFYALLDLGVDIVWGNHPHVTKEWELVKSADGSEMDKLIIYSIGNTISGQNYTFNYEDPGHDYEYTGTSVLLQVDLTKKTVSPSTAQKNAGENELKTVAENPPALSIDMDLEHKIIVTHVDENRNVIIKRLTSDFISTQGKKKADYYTERLQLMQKINGTTIWQ